MTLPGSTSQKSLAYKTTVKPNMPLPADPSWSYIAENYQSWMSQLENDAVSGDHYNLHVQPGSGGSDWSNYHITYEGDNGSSKVWQSYDSVTGETKVYEAWSGFTDDDAAYYAATTMSDDVGASYVGMDTALMDSAYGTTLDEILLSLLLAV